MEFSVSKSALLNELNTTQGVVERKTTIPILSNLLIEANENRLNITATDLELSIRTSCEAKVKKEGAGTIPAKKLLELVRLLPEGEIKVKLLENHWVEIVSDRKKYKLVGMAKENFPTLPAMPHTMVKISAPVIESLIAKTKFAISMEESRYTLNGGLLILKPDTLAMVATDGHRLALAETDQKLTGLSGEMKVLIPKKAMDEVEKLAGAAGSDAQIDFAKDESNLFFQVGHRLLISRILTGQFPNYEAVLPRENNKTVVLERTELADAVRRVSQLADQRSHAVKSLRYPLPARSMAKPRKISTRNTRAIPSPSASTPPTCSIFSPPPRMARSALSSRTNSPPDRCVPWPTKAIATVTSSCPCAFDRAVLTLYGAS